MYEDGADVIYHAAGGAGNGMFAAAKEYSEDNGTKVWGIGVDSDQYNTIGTVDASLQEYVLTSMLKRVDVAVFEILKAQSEGTFAAGPQVYDLSVDGVGYSTSGGYVDDIVADLDAFKDQIIAGDIVVHNYEDDSDCPSTFTQRAAAPAMSQEAIVAELQALQRRLGELEGMLK